MLRTYRLHITQEDYRHIPVEIPDVDSGIETIFQRSQLALWHIHNIGDTPQDNQLGGNTEMVPGFRPYLSDPTDKIAGGCIVESGRVLYCPSALGLHNNRDAFTMAYLPLDNHFYTTLTIGEILNILLRKRKLFLAHFLFASTPIQVLQEIKLEDIVH